MAPAKTNVIAELEDHRRARRERLALLPKRLPCFGHTSTHYGYRLTCSEWEDLCQRAEGRCERCGLEMRKPCIDHDHLLGRQAVRGLVGGRCNSIIAAVEWGIRSMDDLTKAYLDNPFHARISADQLAVRRATFTSSFDLPNDRQNSRPGRTWGGRPVRRAKSS